MNVSKDQGFYIKCDNFSIYKCQIKTLKNAGCVPVLRFQYIVAVFVGFLYGCLVVPGCHRVLEYSRQEQSSSVLQLTRWKVLIRIAAHKKGGGWAAKQVSRSIEKIRDTIGRSPSYRVSSRCFEKFTSCPSISHPALSNLLFTKSGSTVVVLL